MLLTIHCPAATHACLQHFWYFGLPAVLQGLFSNPVFTALRGKGREIGWWASDEADRVDKLCGGRLFQPGEDAEHIPFEVAFDFGQMFVSKIHSAGILSIRCTDIPVSHRGRKDLCCPLIIVPGPKEPPWIELCFRPMYEELRTYGPSVGEVLGRDLILQQRKAAAVEGGKVEVLTSQIWIRIILSGINGDTPGQCKLCLNGGHAGKCSCPHCLGKGQWEGKTIFPGYGAPVQTGVPEELKGLDLFRDIPSLAITGDDRLRLTDERHRVLTEKFLELYAKQTTKKGKKDLTSRFGIHGRADIVGYLGHYISPTSIFIIPLMHAGLLGITKPFLSLAFAKIDASIQQPPWVFSKRSRDLISLRCSQVREHIYRFDGLIEFSYKHPKTSLT